MLKVMKLRKTLLVSGLSSQIILGWKGMSKYSSRLMNSGERESSKRGRENLNHFIIKKKERKGTRWARSSAQIELPSARFRLDPTNFSFFFFIYFWYYHLWRRIWFSQMAPLTKFRKTSLEYGLSSQIILDWKEVVHANSYGVHVCMGRP